MLRKELPPRGQAECCRVVSVVQIIDVAAESFGMLDKEGLALSVSLFSDSIDISSAKICVHGCLRVDCEETSSGEEDCNVGATAVIVGANCVGPMCTSLNERADRLLLREIDVVQHSCGFENADEFYFAPRASGASRTQSSGEGVCRLSQLCFAQFRLPQPRVEDAVLERALLLHLVDAFTEAFEMSLNGLEESENGICAGRTLLCS